VFSRFEMALPLLEDTRNLAEKLASCVGCGDVVTLAGDLGAGKTTFAQYLIKALNHSDIEVISPTFTLLQTYPVILANGRKEELYHYDLYRIEHAYELAELGFEEAIEHVTLIEWPQRLQDMKLPVTLALEFSVRDNVRVATVSGAFKFMEVVQSCMLSLTFDPIVAR